MYSNWNLKKVSQTLRKNMTPQERHLWYDYLHTYKPAFHRQKTVLNYVLDFYCPKAKLAVELDGSQHYEEEQHQYDAKRTEKLQRLGVMVLRFTNREIDKQFEAVRSYIDMLVKERLQSDSTRH